MISAKSIFSFAFLGAALALPALEENKAVAADIARRDVPTVVPGPGLPSLEELGLTSEQLYAMGAPKMLKRNGIPECGPSESAYTDVGDIIACYNYLNNLGTQNCAVGGNFAASQFCRAGKGQVIGQGTTSAAAHSYCRDVASAVLWVINDCTRPDQSVAGFQAAGGNGNLAVGSVNINY